MCVVHVMCAMCVKCAMCVIYIQYHTYIHTYHTYIHYMHTNILYYCRWPGHFHVPSAMGDPPRLSGDRKYLIHLISSLINKSYTHTTYMFFRALWNHLDWCLGHSLIQPRTEHAMYAYFHPPCTGQRAACKRAEEREEKEHTVRARRHADRCAADAVHQNRAIIIIIVIKTEQLFVCVCI